MKILTKTKSFWKDYSTAHYNPITNKIKAKNKYLYAHEKGHQYWHKKGFNDVADEIYFLWLKITLIYLVIMFIEEMFAWFYAIGYLNNGESKKCKTIKYKQK